MGEKSATYETWIGRRCWVKLKWNNGHTCRVICAYQLAHKVKYNMEVKKTFNAQKRRCLCAKVEFQFTRQLFRVYLVNNIKYSMKAGEKYSYWWMHIIYQQRKTMNKIFKYQYEGYCKITDIYERCSYTFLRRRRKWWNMVIRISRTSQRSIHYLWTGLIYHRAFVVDKSHYELIGEPLLWIKLAMARD